jgi:hypothetical protein
MECNATLFGIRAARFVGALFSLTVSGHAWSQSGTAPDYISSMADFQVVQLDGALAPTNGNVSMKSVTPSEWQTNDPSSGGLSAVIIPWSGGAKATGGSSLFVHGGGHSDGANNGLYIYDFSGTTKPTGWQTPLTISPISAILVSNATYSDGLPTSVHTYDGAVWAKHNNTVYRFKGSIYGAGNQTNASFKFNMGTKTWTRLPDYPTNDGFAAVTFYDPVSGNIFVAPIDGTTGHFFRTSTDTWSGQKTLGGSGVGEVAAAWDPTRNRGLVLGEETNRRVLFSLNFSSETASGTPITLTGATEVLRRGISVVYDPGRDSYWLFGGASGDPGWTTIYEIPAGGPWNIVAHPLTGAQIQRVTGMIGSYGRYVFMDQWRAIGVVASTTSPAFVIKLPAASVVSPRSPVNLNAN